ncbi:unnamed protein product, partial [Scytosiphon promiscuus]
MLVVPHTGQMVEDFNEPGTMIAAYFHLFPHGVGGHLDNRPRKLTFNRWARILLRRRDTRFRKSRTFVFCLAAIIFRREAISNSYWKLTGKVSRGVANTLAGITPDDLLAVAREIEGGASTTKALADRPAARKLIQTMQSVNCGATWTIFNKRALRMKAISMIMQLGQPLFWMTINPADKNSPFVMKLAGVDLDVCSRLKTDLPAYVDRLQKIAADPVASADFFHIMIDAVMTCLLRFGARDGDGGVLGRVKAYIGMTEEQKRLTLHCHLLIWTFGFNDFGSLRDIMDKTPESYKDLASFLSRTIFSQVASEADIQHAMQGDPEPPTTGSDRIMPPQNPLERPAKECITVPPPLACFPPPGDERDVSSERHYISNVLHPDLAHITTTANTHQPMVNSYNAIIQYCTRSNMDIKALLRDSDARGALFYILNYSTKTETTMDALLNILAPVVERIKDETNGAPAAVVAAGLVRSCSCKTVAHMSIGAPAAASKVLGYSD